MKISKELSKIFEYAFSLNFATTFRILVDNQHVFRQNKPASTLHDFFDMVIRGLEARECLAALFYDLSV